MMIPADRQDELPEDVKELQHDIWVQPGALDHIMYQRRYTWHCTICHSEGDCENEADAYWRAQVHRCVKKEGK